MSKGEIKTNRYAVVYRDNGPGGPCGQSCSITRLWTKVYLFHSEKDALEWIGANPIGSGRKDAHYAICGNGYDDSIVMIMPNLGQTK